MQRFAGKVVLVTGGTSGIGRALAEAFLAEGAKVAVCARSASGLGTLRRACPEVLTLAADVTDVSAQRSMLDTIQQHFGRLDILVNNAGRLVERDFATWLSLPEDLADEIALNLTSPIQLTALVTARWPQLDAVIFVTSGYALVSPRRAPTYGAAKAGLHGFANGLRRQLAGRGTHVLEVLPPAVDTPATAHRNVRKVSPREVAVATLDALAKGRPRAMVGATKFLPGLLRIAPNLVERMVAKT